MDRGGKKRSSVEHAKGHVKNPASDKDIENKLASLNNGLLPPSRIARLLDVCWRLEEVDDVRELVSVMRV